MSELLDLEVNKGNQIKLDLEENLLKKYETLYKNGAYSEIEFLKQESKFNQLKITVEKDKLEG